MTTTPNEPVRDSDIETGAGLGSSAAPGATGPGDGTRDGAEGGPLDTQDETDADGTDSSDADGTDADGSDSDSSDSDGSDADGSDADGTDADGTDA